MLKGSYTLYLLRPKVFRLISVYKLKNIQKQSLKSYTYTPCSQMPLLKCAKTQTKNMIPLFS